MREIKEADWKLLRKVHPAALERFCKQILTEVKRINSDGAKGYYQRYLDLWELLGRRNKEMAEAFDDLRRSRAIFRIASIKALGVLTEAEFSQFSQETREGVSLLLGIRATER
jgi:hypothetical protein